MGFRVDGRNIEEGGWTDGRLLENPERFEEE